MKQNKVKTLVGSTTAQVLSKQWLSQKLKSTPLPDGELLDNIGLYLTRQTLSRINFIQKLYAMIVPVHGVILEFGVRWGQNMALFQSLRGIMEPYNYNRKVIGFDTFAGFPSVTASDGGRVKAGDYGVTKGWRNELASILQFHQENSPIPHIPKFELVQGDACKTLPNYLQRNPHTIIALAYFDFDIYAPTHDCLKAIRPHLTKGSVLAFDELNCTEFPGETKAVSEVLGIGSYAIQRDPNSPLTSYLVIT